MSDTDHHQLDNHYKDPFAMEDSVTIEPSANQEVINEDNDEAGVAVKNDELNSNSYCQEI